MKRMGWWGGAVVVAVGACAVVAVWRAGRAAERAFAGGAGI